MRSVNKNKPQLCCALSGEKVVSGMTFLLFKNRDIGVISKKKYNNYLYTLTYAFVFTFSKMVFATHIIYYRYLS